MGEAGHDHGERIARVEVQTQNYKELIATLFDRLDRIPTKIAEEFERRFRLHEEREDERRKNDAKLHEETIKAIASLETRVVEVEKFSDKIKNYATAIIIAATIVAPILGKIAGWLFDKIFDKL